MRVLNPGILCHSHECPTFLSLYIPEFHYFVMNWKRGIILLPSCIDKINTIRLRAHSVTWVHIKHNYLWLKMLPNLPKTSVLVSLLIHSKARNQRELLSSSSFLGDKRDLTAAGASSMFKQKNVMQLLEMSIQDAITTRITQICFRYD